MGPAVSVSCGGWHTCVVTEAGEVSWMFLVFLFCVYMCIYVYMCISLTAQQHDPDTDSSIQTTNTPD